MNPFAYLQYVPDAVKLLLVLATVFAASGGLGWCWRAPEPVYHSPCMCLNDRPGHR